MFEFAIDTWDEIWFPRDLQYVVIDKTLNELSQERSDLILWSRVGNEPSEPSREPLVGNEPSQPLARLGSRSKTFGEPSHERANPLARLGSAHGV